ncbi:acyl-CoA dehydrogenase family protein [Dietzia aurantiaca]|uniref:acyl-CoA dehydrogenase family protein n=1 Tax=Dietzia aurantiaca TaxID=983873 RepID=UPI001E6334CE|nr:acyl-CoA dehydrogenase family protein [Dietzia aurantiaca]MCD2262014.1 acyl-CoA dehydrogenase family protein [Dietzia aurantiaca]
MDFSPSPRAADLTAAVREFIATRIAPVESQIHADIARRRLAGEDSWAVDPRLTALQAAARAEGLWNLFLPAGHEGPYAERYGTRGGAGLTNSDYAPVAEEMGRSFLAPLVFNCNAPDTGNMEVLLKYGSAEQKDRWLDPLLAGEIRSAFLMTEPEVASSDASTMAATARISGDEVVLDGHKWWSTGVGHPDCRVGIFMGVTDPDAHRYLRHSMVLVPMDAPGVTVERMLTAQGMFDEPLGHGEVRLEGVRLPVSNIIAGPGRAAEIAQGRLGPGRVHHCMRLIGLAELALDLACRRASERVAFGKPIVNLGGNRERLAEARIAIDQARLLVQHAAWKLDTEGQAAVEVSAIKVAVPRMAQQVIDMAMQLHGGAGMSDDFPLAGAYATARALRLADGPDEVHLGVVARALLAPYRDAAAARTTAEESR